MAKTDKELTAEIVIASMQAWSGPGKTPVKSGDLPELIKLIFDAVHSLPDEDQK